MLHTYFMLSEKLSPAPKSHDVSVESIQKEQYERISPEYNIHYNDPYSQKYMRRFVFETMFAGIDLNNKNVLEAMCGGGQTAKYLLEKNARVTGIDISPQQIASFQQRHPSARTICASILNSGIESQTFDVVSVIGGVHHMPPYIAETLLEIHRILKPGGYFCFMEPHRESMLETFRKAWYKRDNLFAENEEAVNMSELRSEFNNHFEFIHEHYLGNIAYLLVLNSMVFRIPIKLKKFYSPALIAIESLSNKILGKPFSCFVIAQWQKK